MNDAIKNIEEMVGEISPVDIEDVGDKVDILTVEKTDEEVKAQAKLWTERWAPDRDTIDRVQTSNVRYWEDGTASQNCNKEDIDNHIFPNIETLLPNITSTTPEPLVDSVNTTEKNTELAKGLFFIGKKLGLKLLGRKTTRMWAMSRLGVVKASWSIDKDDITLVCVDPVKLILEKGSVIKENGRFSSRYIGEEKTDTAESLALRFPKKKKEISKAVDDKMGTILKYTEWWTKDMVFWICKDIVLFKSKFPHWNEKIEVDLKTDTGEEEEEVKNYFDTPELPYIPLTVFNLGIKPYDRTSLIEQASKIQDAINNRNSQININADNSNNGLMVNADVYTKEKAAKVAQTIREGGVAYASFSAGDPIKKLDAQSLPAFIPNTLNDYRNELSNIIGTTGLSSNKGGQGTVRGQIMDTAKDTNRSSTITDYLERFYSNIYEYIIQMIVVYYDEERMLAGDNDYKNIKISADSIPENIDISIKEGSLVPKDPMTMKNQALDLWAAGAIDPESFFRQLGFPNPLELAKKLVLWKTNPAEYLALLEKGQGIGEEQINQIPPPVPDAPPGQNPGVSTNQALNQGLLNKEQIPNVSPSLAENTQAREAALPSMITNMANNINNNKL